jgi:hypothetical protein
MANFSPPVNPTSDPSYMGNNFTQGTDRAQLQPLAEVPGLSVRVYTPDYTANKTAGQALEGISKLGDLGVSLTDAAIKNKLDDTLHKGIDQIRDSFGVAQAADIAQGMPSPTDGGTLAQGGADKDVPVAVNRLGAKVQGLTEAYRQGVFDDTAYYGKLEAYVRQVKAQFPGYTDVVDQKVQQITGTTPANALRSALLQNVKEINAKQQAAADKQATMEHQDAGYIHQLYPNYEALKAAGKAPPWEEVQMNVGKMKAREWAVSAKTAELAMDRGITQAVANKAEDIATQALTDISGHLVLGSTNAMGLRTPQDFQQLFNDINSGKRATLTPDEKQMVASSMAQLKQQYLVEAEKFLTKPLAEGSTETLTSKINDSNKRSAIVNQGMSMITDLEDGLFNEKHGIAAQTVNWNKARLEAAEGDFLRQAPIAATVAAGRKFYGDNGAIMLNLYNGPLATSMMEGFRQFNQGQIASGSGSLKQTFDVFKQNGQMDPNLWKAALQDGVNTIIHSDKVDDKDAPKKAVQHLFGPGNTTLIDSFNGDPGSQTLVFNNLVSPQMVRAVEKLDTKSKETFYQFANSGFASVYATQAMGANSNAKAWSRNSNLTLGFNPATGNFEYTGNRLTPSNMLQSANRGLGELNSAINSMKEVWKSQGKTPMEEVYRLLPIIGVDPGTPLYKAVQDKVQAEENSKENPR